MPFEPIQVVVGAAFGFASTGFLRWWQYGRDQWLSRVSRFYDTLEEAADISGEHWLANKASVPSTGIIPPEDDDAYMKKLAARNAIEHLEARILGLQMRLDGLLASFDYRFTNAHNARIQSAMNRLSDAMGGGAFLSVSRPPDPNRARSAHYAASELIVLVSEAVNEALTFAGWFTFLRERAARWHAWSLDPDRSPERPR